MVGMGDVIWFLETIYIYLPAYIANSTPVILTGGGSLDGDKKFIDGEPILGTHKTIRGTFSGLIAGTLTGIIQGQPYRGALMAIGAILGDLVVSFIKRRLKLPPGTMFPIADQMSFIVLAVMLDILIAPAIEWDRILVIFLATLPIHYFANVIAWMLKLKSRPW